MAALSVPCSLVIPYRDRLSESRGAVHAFSNLEHCGNASRAIHSPVVIVDISQGKKRTSAEPTRLGWLVQPR